MFADDKEKSVKVRIFVLLFLCNSLHSSAARRFSFSYSYKRRAENNSRQTDNSLQIYILLQFSKSGFWLFAISNIDQTSRCCLVGKINRERTLAIFTFQTFFQTKATEHITHVQHTAINTYCTSKYSHTKAFQTSTLFRKLFLKKNKTNEKFESYFDLLKVLKILLGLFCFGDWPDTQAVIVNSSELYLL